MQARLRYFLTGILKLRSYMQVSELNTRASLIIKVALLLNYLSKDDYQKLSMDITKEAYSEVDLFKVMLMNNYIRRMDISILRRNCSVFDAALTDMRFGQLCLAFGFLTRFNLELALDEQRRLATVGNSVRLGKLLVDAGMLAKGQRNLVIHKQKGETDLPPLEPFKKEAGSPGQAPTSEPAPDFNMTGFDSTYISRKISNLLYASDHVPPPKRR